MANYNFNLKDSKSTKSTPIKLVIRYSGKKIVFYTGESIHPDFWNYDKQRVKQTKKYPEHPEFNLRLDNILTTVKNEFNRYKNDHNHEEPTPSEFKKLIESKIRGTKNKIPDNFIEFTEWFINKTKKQLELENRNNSRGDISRSYNQTLNIIKDFAKDKNKRVDFDTIDHDFYQNLVEYMQTVKKVVKPDGKEVNKYGLKANTIGKHIKNLKRILNEASSPEIAINKFTFYRKFEVFSEEVDSIYLNQDELEEMYNLKLSERLSGTRDLFIVSAWTGLRFSDFTTIKKKDIQGDFIYVKTQKTGKKVVIPIHWTVKNIIDKYNHALPPAVSNAEMNRSLKEIGGEMESMDKFVTISETKAGMKVEKKVEKWKLITSHSGRRSFATNMYLMNIPIVTIMAITGHTSEKTFLSYIKVTPEEHAKKIKMIWEQQQKLRIAL